MDPVEPEPPDLEDVQRISRLFQTEDGEKVLQQWLDSFCMDLRTDMDPSGYKQGFLDGQAHIPKMIVSIIRTLNNE